MFDCQACGACCVNSDHNRAEGYRWYVDADDPRSALLTARDLLRRYVMPDADGAPHLKLHADGRCTALRGKLGRRVSCEVYRRRPAARRRVEPGDAACLQARAERGIETI